MEIRCHLTEKGKEKTERYIKELLAKRKNILDAKLDTADDTNIPTAQDIEDDIAWDCSDKVIDTGFEYINSFGVTDNLNADYPLGLKEGEDFTLFRMLNDFFKWEFVCGKKEGYIAVEGMGIYQYEMTLSPDVRDDECMRVEIDGKHYYFG